MKKLCLLFFLVFFIFQEEIVSPVANMQPMMVEAEVEQSKLVSLNQLIETRSQAVKLDVPVIRQLPELYNGCEVTSLAMLLHASGSPVDKVQLAKQVKKDPTPFKGSSLTQISQWGNPNEGFVGDITGKKKGYGVYNGPIFDLLQNYVEDQAVNLTGKEFSALEWVLDQGNPIVVWTTASFQPTNRWVTWKKEDQTIKATFQEHAVLLVGYDQQFVYINDPLSGRKAHQISKDNFIKSWEQMGSQAVSIVQKENLYVFYTE